MITEPSKAIFDDHSFSWRGREYVIRSNAVLRVIASVEDIVTLPELFEFMRRGTAPPAKLACAYGAVLRAGGCLVTDDEVYQGIVVGDDVHGVQRVGAAIKGLLSLMIPKQAPKGVSKGNGRAGGVQPTSKKRSKRSSPAAKSSALATSGS